MRSLVQFRLSFPPTSSGMARTLEWLEQTHRATLGVALKPMGKRPMNNADDRTQMTRAETLDLK
jgi:hypothetical protein